ncbi:MAG: hypothetical protein KAY32_13765 [Candidatus Eisenbacteria sp.]|nr:hypothetical protein [Candidatus Eisenbacteria bacterium]
MGSTLRMRRVLLVEPNRACRERYRQELRRAGYAVAATGSSRSALRRLARGERPDALVLDAGADRAGRHRVLESALRADPSMTVLLSTSEGGLWRDFTSWAADGVVHKAQPAAELTRALAGTLGGRQAGGSLPTGQGVGKNRLTVRHAPE